MSDPQTTPIDEEIKKLRGIIINLTNAAAVALSGMGDTDSAAFLKMEVRVALRDAGLKEGDQA